MRITGRVLVFLAGCALSTIAQAQNPIGTMTAETFLGICRSGKPDDQRLCEAALFAVAVTHAVDQQAGGAKKLLCPSPDATPADLRTAAVTQLSAAPKLLKELYVGAAIVALAKAYPCK